MSHSNNIIFTLKESIGQKMKKTERINCNVRVEELEYWGSGDLSLPANQTYTLVVDYPFSIPGHFPIKTGKGMGLSGLFKEIYKAYIKQYVNAEKQDDNGYWHGIEDLAIQGIRVNHKKKEITLDVGS